MIRNNPWAHLSGDEAVKAWRDAIPFTDDQIADALLQAGQVPVARGSLDYHLRMYSRMADWVRSGHLSSKILGLALPYLVKTCSALQDGTPCGRKAIYRIGREGRCSRHRDVKPSWHRSSLAVKEANSGSIDGYLDHVDRGLRARDRLRGTRS